ncbi:hypothetical protein B0H10DRAFT_2007240, partial [Mycena sp. CBHHK59/15]
MSAFCPSPLHPRCVALAACGISPVVHCFALSAVCGPFTANQPPFTLPTSGKPQISLYILLILVSFAGFRCPLETNSIWVTWRESCPTFDTAVPVSILLTFRCHTNSSISGASPLSPP